jgi:hypothetical protein
MIPLPSMLRPTPALTLALTAVIAACSGDRGGAAGDVPWRTVVDSTGDTVHVRVTGDVPASRVSTLVPELEVGAEDGSEEETFGRIGTVLGTPDGGLLVHDAQATAVRLFDARGGFVRTLGGQGGGPGEYEHINGITTLPDGRVVLWDAAGNRLNLYEGSGEFVRTWLLPFTGYFTNNALWSDAAADVYAFATFERDAEDPRNNRHGLIRMDTAGRILDSLPYLRWREEARPMEARSPDGRMMTARSRPFAPGNVTRLLPSGGLVSGPGDPYVLYVTHPDGRKPIRVEREHAPVPVTSTEQAEIRAQTEFSMRRVDPSWSWTGAAIPATKPAYRGLFTGRDGRIWVSLSTAAVPIPEAERPAPRPGEPQPPQLTTHDPIVYDVLSSTGRLLGRVALPPRVRLYTMDGDRVWGVRRDSLDVEYAVRYRIEPALMP